MPLEKYEPFFGLTEAPFSLAPDPRFLFASASISAALEQLAYALGRREPLIVVTGEIGTGKTLLCRAVMKRIPRETFLSVIDDPLLERDDLLKQMLEDFGVIAKDRSRLTETTRHELVEALQAFLRSLSAIQAHAVVAIDEAQHLRPDVLEQIRLLSNMNDERGTLLQIILVGQPELETLLSQPELRQLQQRVTRRFRLEPLNQEEVREYIDHRLALARNGASRAPGAAELANELAAWSGRRDAQFTDEAVQAVFEISRGFPRVINLLCDRSLEAACASNLRVVDAFGINKAASALGVGSLGAPRVSGEESAAPARPPKPEHSFWVSAPAESRSATPAVESLSTFAADEPGSAEVPAAPRQRPKYVLLAASLALVAFVAVWYGLRAATSQEPHAAPSATPPVNRAPSPGGSPSDAAGAPPPQPAATAPARPATPPATAPAGAASAPPPTTPAAPPATPAAERFEIVVASFRTDTRATAVSTEIAALGLPVRRRVADTWQQVIVGPFKSRQEADDAQQRLQRAGMGGAQIIPVR